MRQGVGTAVRSAREVAASLRETPFRAALAVSALVHVFLLVCVRVGPMPALRPASPQMRLQIIRVMPEAEVAAVVAPESPGRRGGVDPRPIVKTGPAPAPAATAAVPVDPVDPAVPADPVAGAGSIPARPVAGTVTPAKQELPAVEPAAVASSAAEPVVSEAAAPAAPAEIPLSPPLPKGEAGGFEDSGSDTPAGAKIAAAGIGAVGEPAAAQGVSGARLEPGQPGSGGSGEHGVARAARAPAAAPPAADPASLTDLRRRIDARKIYPQIAVRNGWEGRVLVEMRLADDGRLAGLRLLEGSGYRVLDEATLAAVRRAAPFPPVAGPVTVPVEYRLTP